MRVLGASTANDGHFGPLVPFLTACAEAGHQVAVATPESFAGRLGRAGFQHLPFADAPPDLLGPVMAGLMQLEPHEADATVVRDVFGRIDAQAALPGLRRAIADWRPDVVLREPAELGSLAAAEEAGVPHVQVAIGMQEMDRYFAGLLPEPLAELGELVGAPADGLASALRAARVVSPVPESLDRAGDPAFAPADVLRCHEPAPIADRWVTTWGDEPLVYVSFGTVAGSLPPFQHVFRDALDAFAGLPVRVLMTVGRGFDIASLGHVPDNAQVEAWVSQTAVLEQAAAVVCHGGFGTTLGALAAGVPLVVVPLFTSDQAINGRHAAAAGAGRTVEPSPDAVSQAAPLLTAVLDDPAYAAGARSMAEQMAALAPTSAVVALLEEVVG
jgi:UDP:flavonoid glycosyltransferase YjiC (YdhE family)